MNEARHRFRTPGSKLPIGAFIGFFVLFLVVLALIIWAIVTFRGDDIDMNTLSPGQVASHPEQFYGQTLALTGTIDDKLGTRALGLEGVLVIANEDIPASAHDGGTISVSGKVVKYDAGTVTSQGMVAPGSPKLDGWRDQPMLIATAVEYK